MRAKCLRAEDSAPLTADESRRVRRALTVLGLPELADPLVPPSDLIAREALAASYAHEGSSTAVRSDRDALIGRAEVLYAAVIAARQAADRPSDTDRVALARCRVAAASTILRCSLVPDLDRFEITSGLSAQKSHLLRRLSQSIQLYEQADQDLSNLKKLLAADEERFLLLGLSDPIRKLHRECLLNLAWAQVWRAAVENKPVQAVEPLTQAIRRFDAIVNETPSVDERNSARLGMAVALRNLRRFDDALAVLDRIEQDHPPYVVAVRACCERGRTLVAAGRFAQARAVLTTLSAVALRDIPDAHAAARFDVMLAPVLIADSFLLESATKSGDDGAALRRQGIEGLTALVARGGEWPDIVETYLTARGIHRDRSQRSAAELAIAAQRAMQERAFAEAVPLWREAAAKSLPGHARVEAQYNLGVSLFQTGALSQAATTFEGVARMEPPDALSDSAADYAYRCRAQVANQTRKPADWSALADACRVLVARFPKHADAAQAAWAEPLALQEASNFDEARVAFAKFGPDSPHYWDARRAAVSCRRAALERRRAASDKVEWNALADEWRALASDLDVAAHRNDPRVDAAAPQDAQLSAAEVLAADICARYRDALTMLAAIDAQPGLSPALRGRILGIRIRCHRGLGQFEQAAAVLDEYLRDTPAVQAGDVLIGLSAGMEAEVDRLVALERGGDAKRVAQAAVPTLRQLVAWIEKQPARKGQLPVVRLSLIHMMEQAGQVTDALAQVRQLMKNEPGNGIYLQRAARLTEQVARDAHGADRASRMNEAEQLWAKLLADASLRTSAPMVYWEARYQWLKLRLDGGHADEVARGIASEQAWYPTLGGAPWQGRLLELADEARRQSRRASNP